MNKLSCTIPFSGFYDSWHDAEFDQSLEMMFDPEGTGAASASALQGRFFDTVNWRAAQTDYAKAYVENIASALGFKSVEWEEMVSPREYNFGTDRLFAKFELLELQEFFNRADVRKTLNTVAADMFTSRSGFMSSYSPDVESWGDDLKEWDYNQRGALIHAAANVILADGENFGQENEIDLMESERCNGEIDNYIWSNTDDNAAMGNRCDRIASYLAIRESR